MTIWLYAPEEPTAGELYRGPVPPPFRYRDYLVSYGGSPSELLQIAERLETHDPLTKFSACAPRAIRRFLRDSQALQETPNA